MTRSTKKATQSKDKQAKDRGSLFSNSKRWQATASVWKQSLLIAGPFLTCFPWPRPKGRIKKTDLGESVRAFPLVGLIIAALGCLVWWPLSVLGVAPLAASLVALAVMAALTGGLHEDGLADTADSLFGGDTPSQRLELMRRGDIGAYGALALIFSVALRAALLASLDGVDIVPALLAAVSASRAAPVVLARRLEPIRQDGLAVALGIPPAGSHNAALIVAAIFLFLFLGLPAAITAILIAGGMLHGLEYLAKTRLGGVTGDIMGAGQQLAEMAILLAAAMIL